MFTIGEFASLSRVSIRMLRHYDAIGLLRPASIDSSSGYRLYRADQLRRLNRIVALKDLGFTLQQVQQIIDDKVDVTELRGMLRLRRAQLEVQMAADAARLTGVEARLRMIEREGFMSTEEVVLKQIAPIRVATLTATAAGYGPEQIGPVIQPLYGQLCERMLAAGLTLDGGPAVAYYEPADGESVIVHAGRPTTADASAAKDFAIVDLPMVPTAATIIHRGSMDDVMQSEHILARWIEDNGYKPVGLHREVYLDYHPDKVDEGITELQIAVVRA
ncbi:MerR family transcriptional regulator [Allorhizocola rhizosphaerae]|uniref:MerR family transcriptional regulator n=1 Tax=Allorhizocola rhizosphaerae TaxID=1872709 RepID=UPI000E3D382F|nr:MerR family transcriptional regulator [Allorhizocola rhizosphaerae]